MFCVVDSLLAASLVCAAMPLGIKRIPEDYLLESYQKANKRPKVPPPIELVKKRRDVSPTVLCESFCIEIMGRFPLLWG